VGEDIPEALRELATAYVADLGVDTVILAGTELALVPAGTWSGIDVTDCAAIHIDAIAAASLRSGPSSPS